MEPLVNIHIQFSLNRYIQGKIGKNKKDYTILATCPIPITFDGKNKEKSANGGIVESCVNRHLGAFFPLGPEPYSLQDSIFRGLRPASLGNVSPTNC